MPTMQPQKIFLPEEVAMKCEQISELLPDYLQGGLSPDQHRTVEAHLQQCADCSEEVAVWRKLSLLPVEQPSPMSRVRFEAMLKAYQAGRSNEDRKSTRLNSSHTVISYAVFCL